MAELEKRYPGETFSAVTQEQILGVVGRILGLLTLVLAAIAGISLLVGGVGISNIMLVSVRERTREIGLRKAVGARPRDVLVQFLLEAVLLTTIGGLIGIGIGVGVAVVVGQCHAAADRGDLVVDACWPSGCRRRSACSSAWCRPGGPAGWTRWSRCAPNERAGIAPVTRSTATLHSARACPSSPEGKPAPRHVPRSGEPCRRRNRPMHRWRRSSS